MWLRSLLALAILVLPMGFAVQAHGQSAVPIVTATCGTQSLTATRNASPYENTSGNLCTNASATLSGTTSNASSGVATSSTNVPTVSYNYGFNGTTWDQLQVDASKFLKVNCATGCAGGTTSNASSGVATSSTNGASVSWLYGFNGTTWDQLQVDASKFLKVNIAAGTVAATQSGTWNVANTGTFATQSAITAASGSIASGALASGSIASGACASGCFASGAISNGGDVVLGNNTDSASCASATSLIACARQLHTDATSAIPAGTNLIGKVGIDQTTVGTTNAVSIAQIGANTVSTGNGVSGTGNLRVNIASDNTAFAVNDQPTPVTSGGLTTFFLQPAASDNHTNVKNGAGQVYHVAVTNNSATINYLRFYNAASGFNGCNSATNLVYQLAIPANTSGAGFVEDIAMGLVFSTGISICVTSGYATTDTTNATATAMSLLIGYK